MPLKSLQIYMPDSFTPYEIEYNDWKNSGYTGCKSETIEFIEHLLHRKEGLILWPHEKEAILRIIYSYEVKQNALGHEYLLRIVTGGGKSLIIGAIIAWLKYAHRNEFDKFVIIVPNLIVRDRLAIDFVRSEDNSYKTIFETWHLSPDDNLNKIITGTSLESGGEPEKILTSDIVVTNIQELYTVNANTARNLDYLLKKCGDLAIFNDEAHNSVAPEFTNVLHYLKSKTKFRLDTTATPERADGTYPDSRLIYNFNITDAMDSEKQIIKNIIVFQPESRIVEITYTNAITKERKKINEFTEEEMEQYERKLKPFHWIMDPAPMRMLLSISINALKQKKKEANGKYKPLLFVITMGIEEAKNAQRVLQTYYGINTLLVTEESDEENRLEARKIGSKNSKYEAVVSIFMLREGWDVAEVSVILLLRRIMSPVFGQQIIGRGLRKIDKTKNDPETVFVIDHPKMDHGWLWKMMNVSKIRQGILPTDEIGEEKLPPKTNYIQKLVNVEKFIKIKEPLTSNDFQTKLELIRNSLSEEEIIKNWRDILNSKVYESSQIYEITAIRLETIKKRRIGKKFGTEIEGPEGKKLFKSEEDIEITIADVKDEIMSIIKTLLEENTLDYTRAGDLYNVMLDHIIDKILGGKSLSDASPEELKLVIKLLPEVEKSFTGGIIKGILSEGSNVTG
ncbi:MAG: DEAD/DEAH box helicase family protein [Thermoplasmata archaeon]